MRSTETPPRRPCPGLTPALGGRADTSRCDGHLGDPNCHAWCCSFHPRHFCLHRWPFPASWQVGLNLDFRRFRRRATPHCERALRTPLSPLRAGACVTAVPVHSAQWVLRQVHQMNKCGGKLHVDCAFAARLSALRPPRVISQQHHRVRGEIRVLREETEAERAPVSTLSPHRQRRGWVFQVLLPRPLDWAV